MRLQVAIDGPAGAGKSTVARELARRLGIEYIDTGAMYRAVALKATRLGRDLGREESYDFLGGTVIDIDRGHVLLDGEDVTEAIRAPAISAGASLCSTFASVRQALVKQQQAMARAKSVVMDGRDIASVVLPQAQVKIYLDASPEVRARRRFAENQAKGIDKSYDDTLADIMARDHQDMTRKNSPLMQTEDAVRIDTSNYNVEAVVAMATALVENRRNEMENKDKEIAVNEETTAATVTEEKAEDVKEAPQESAVTVEAPAEKEECATVAEAADDVTPDDEPAEEGTLAESLAEDKKDGKKKAAKAEASKYKQLQVVDGTVVRVEAPQPERTFGEKVVKAKEERVLIRLEDGQEGYLFRRDAAGIPDDLELADYFFDDDKVQVVIKKIYPDGGKFVFSTVLLKMREDLKSFEPMILEHGTFKATVTKALPFGILLKYNDYSCLCGYGEAIDSKSKWPELVGQEIEVAPIRVDYNRIRLIVSQKVALAIDRRAGRKDFRSALAVGQKYTGTVKNIETYGAFVEIYPGVEGLLHISELSHTRVFKVEKVLAIGDKVDVQVIAVDGSHIGLSRKALIPNYWQDYVDAHKKGEVVTGKATEVNKYGVVVDLAEDVSAFLPRSEYSWDREVSPENEVKPGDEITAVMDEIDDVKRRIILSKKKMSDNPWSVLGVKQGDMIDVVIEESTKGGFKFNYNGITGFLPTGGVMGDPDKLTPGTKLQLRVRVVDSERGRLLGSMRTGESRGSYSSSRPASAPSADRPREERRPRPERTSTPAPASESDEPKMTASFADFLAAYQKNK